MSVTSTSDVILAAAHTLRTAARTGVACPPVRDLIGTDRVEVAYAVQQQLVAERITAGARVVGRKIGLTSPAVQAQLGVDRPDFGVLLDDMEVTDGVAPMSRLLQPKVEAELAFVLRADLDGPLDLDRVGAAIGRAHVALEIVDSRVRDWDISFADTVADNASAGLFALGSQLPSSIDPALVTMTMSRNRQVVSTGRGADCLGNPLNALLWLAETARDLGDPLRAGQVILSGALGPMASVDAGDEVEAVISLGGLPLGHVAVSFAQGADR